MKKILFISGSLRKGSLNTQLLKKASEMLSDDFDCSFLSYGDIPLLNQDDEFPAPPSVSAARAEVGAADALWIGSPEYNHSYAAALKNLIDWLSRPQVPGDYSTASGRGKIVAVSSAAGSSGGSFSLEKLEELMRMLSCTVLEERTLIRLGDRFSEKELVLTAEETAQLEAECSALRRILS